MEGLICSYILLHYKQGVVAESEDIIKASVEGLGKNGFINYYGLQRFGSGSVPTHLVGAALLRGEWRSSVNLILDPREGDILDLFYPISSCILGYIAVPTFVQHNLILRTER